MITVQQAKELCVEAHKGQWRRPFTLFISNIREYKEKYPEHKIGDCFSDVYDIYKPYHTHPFLVADMMYTEDEKIVAYLHDLIEDTSATLYISSSKSHLKYKKLIYNLSFDIAYAINMLTKKNELTYIENINRVVYSKLATKIKIVDIIHNLSDNPSKNQKEKYIKALPILLKAL